MNNIDERIKNSFYISYSKQKLLSVCYLMKAGGLRGMNVGEGVTMCMCTLQLIEGLL
jgi:hypothetical protein